MVEVDIKNADMKKGWDGPEGDHWTEHAERYDATGRRYDRHLFEAARLASDARVLDVGCGTGLSTREAARIASHGSAFGVDLSARMIERARELSREAGIDNATFEQADAQIYPFLERGFDAAISRFGAMFFGDPIAAFRNIARALRPGARLTLFSWRRLADNEWILAIRDALAAGRALPDRPAGQPGPFGLADPDDVRRILDASDFQRTEITMVNEAMCFGADVDDAFFFVSGLGIARALLDGLDDARKQAARSKLRDVLAAHATPEGVSFSASAWLVTAHRA